MFIAKKNRNFQFSRPPTNQPRTTRILRSAANWQNPANKSDRARGCRVNHTGRFLSFSRNKDNTVCGVPSSRCPDAGPASATSTEHRDSVPITFRQRPDNVTRPPGLFYRRASRLYSRIQTRIRTPVNSLLLWHYRPPYSRHSAVQEGAFHRDDPAGSGVSWGMNKVCLFSPNLSLFFSSSHWSAVRGERGRGNLSKMDAAGFYKIMPSQSCRIMLVKNRSRPPLSKHDTLAQCWVNVGPPSATLAQH